MQEAFSRTSPCRSASGKEISLTLLLTAQFATRSCAGYHDVVHRRKDQMKNSFYMITAMIITTALISGCGYRDINQNLPEKRDYRQDMRDFVQSIAVYVERIHPGFIIIPQNGHELLTEDGEETGSPAMAYLNAIDGVGREDLFYGYTDDNVPTPVDERNYMIAFMDIAENHGVEVLVTDYSWSHTYMDNSYAQNEARGYISFAADHRELDNIPAYPAEPYHVNTSNITSWLKLRTFSI
ncbi:MAG: hypothetical protein ACE5JP_12435 [Candidatus Bipolaricaulia bacterium]